MDLTEYKGRMQKALEALKNDLATIRTGRATPSLVENISVSVYGGSARMRIMELATISAADSQLLVITPFDPSIASEIHKGILEANTGLTPAVDGQNIRISIPPLSTERRQQLIHLMKQKLESGKVMIRQVRQDAMQDVKKAELTEDDKKRLEKEIQDLTNSVIGEIDGMGKHKEQELLAI